jgi:hypothetical protein
MMRTLNFAFVLITGMTCLGLYRIAEEARVAQADLVSTDRAIAHEHQTITVLGAEWARVTQPARIAALAERHLDLADVPSIELSSLTSLPRKNAPLADTPLREARATVPAQAGHAEPLKVIAFRTGM